MDRSEIAAKTSDYHKLMGWLSRLVRDGHLGNVEIAAVFCGKWDRPYQIVLRDNETQVVELADLYRHGVLNFRGIPFHNIENSAPIPLVPA